MNVVSNSSPLVGLARIGKLELLQALYTNLTVPEAVWQEVVVAGSDQPGADQVREADWIQRWVVTNRQLVRALQQDLDAGEAEAIALALETEADLLLIDDRLGRNSAHHLGITYVGVIGVIVEAKHKGFIATVKPELNLLRDIAGFRISDRLYTRILQDEGEI
jgi:uncharacterized protein